MVARRVVSWGVVFVAVIMLVSSLGIVAAGGARPTPAVNPLSARISGAAVTAPGHPAASRPYAAIQPNGPTVPKTPRPVTTPEGSSLPYGIAEAESEIHAGVVPASAVLLPRAPPTTGIPAAGSPITGPSYSSVPAPMGLADFGRGATGPYEYNTSSFASTLNLTNFTDYNPGYSSWDATPNWMTFQLNTVTVNTSYPGATNGSFWIQNVVHFNGTSLQFEDNIWNFSSSAACLGPGTLLSYYGQQSGCFYYVYGPTFQVTYPMTLTLYNNLTIYNDSGRMVPGVYFNYSLTYGGSTHAGLFDFVTFNGNAVASAPPQFQVNGFTYNPLGYLFYDAEIIFGGNGGGANAMIAALNGTATLDYLPSGQTRYRSVPSAYDYGGDTGETAEGVAATWSGTTETLTQGPSFLYGLWNTTNSTFGPHATDVSIQLDYSNIPSYGFGFATN
ncbi:Peptidase A5, thermopsin, partial [mine drainage metagenome]